MRKNFLPIVLVAVLSQVTTAQRYSQSSSLRGSDAEFDGALLDQLKENARGASVDFEEAFGGARRNGESARPRGQFTGRIREAPPTSFDSVNRYQPIRTAQAQPDLRRRDSNQEARGYGSQRVTPDGRSTGAPLSNNASSNSLGYLEQPSPAQARFRDELTTRETSYFTRPLPSDSRTDFTANQSAERDAGGGNTPSHQANTSSAEGTKNGTSDAPSNPSGQESKTTSGSKLPLWPTMGLFASLAANLFFGWVAWDTHARYRDFVDETSQSESRRERQARRLRSDSPASRRSHEEEEADFLRSGVEV